MIAARKETVQYGINVSIFVHEPNPAAWCLAHMNLDIHGIEARLEKRPGAPLVRNQRAAKAEVAVLVTQVLPKDVSTFHRIDGTSPHSRQRVQAIVEAFTTMQDDLAKERRVLQAQWAKREKQLERVLLATAGMYGDLLGIAGQSVKEIEGLEVLALATEEDNA